MKYIKSLYSPAGYRLALEARCYHEIGSDGWKVANRIVEVVIDGMLEQKSSWMLYEMIGELQSMIEASETHPHEEIDQQIDDLVDKLFIYGFEDKVRAEVELPDRWRND